MTGRTAVALIGTVLAGAVVAGCSEQGDDYCAEVAEHQVALSDIAASDDPGALFDALAVYRQLRDAAPPDLADEWSQVVGRLAALEAAVESAGVAPPTYDPKDPPEDLTEQERTAIEGAARDLGDPSTRQAMGGLEQQALDVCKTPLSR